MPPVDAQRIAEAQVTVAVILAGFAFAGFVFLLTRVGKKKTRHEDSKRFDALLLLAGAFSIGAFSAFLYATSIGIEPWPSYRSLIMAHGSFVLLSIVAVAAVLRLLDLRDTDDEVLPYAWFLAAFMMTFFQLRFIAELFRAESNLEGGSEVVAWLIVGIAVVGIVAAWGIAVARAGPTGSNGALPYTIALAATATFIGAGHVYFSFTSSMTSVPTAMSVALMVTTTTFAGWSLVVSRPETRPGQSERTVEAGVNAGTP